MLEILGSIVKHNTIGQNISFHAEQLNITPYYLSQITESSMRYQHKHMIYQYLTPINKKGGVLHNTDLPIKRLYTA